MNCSNRDAYFFGSVTESAPSPCRAFTTAPWRGPCRSHPARETQERSKREGGGGGGGGGEGEKHPQICIEPATEGVGGKQVDQPDVVPVNPLAHTALAVMALWSGEQAAHRWLALLDSRPPAAPAAI